MSEAVAVAPAGIERTHDPHIVLSRALLARLLAVAALLWLGVCALVGWTSLREGSGDFDQRQQAFAALLADSIAAIESETGRTVADAQDGARRSAPEAGLPPSLLRALDSAHHLVRGPQPGLVVPATAPHYGWQVFDAHERPIARSPDAPPIALATRDGLSDFTDRDGRRWRVARRASGDGRLTAIVAEPVRDRIAALAPRVLAIGASLALFAVIGAWLATVRAAHGVRTLGTRLHLLSRQAEIGGARLDPRGLPAEIAPVAAAVNALLERCTRRIEREREFVADAVHELRTPLAAVLAHARLLADARDATERRSAESALRTGTARISHLLLQIQAMSWLSTPQVPAQGTIDAAELVRLRVASLSALARERFVRIALRADERIDFDIDPTNLASVIDNLVDNAIRHAEFCGAVEVRLERRGLWLRLAVLDDGPGIPIEHRERVFERFHRVPGNGVSGTGLGLSIVKRVADLHGARVTVGEGLRGRGAGITIEIPPPGERPGVPSGPRPARDG